MVKVSRKEDAKAMITTKKELREYLAADAKADGRASVRATIFGDEVWKFQIALRKLEYYKNRKGISRYLTLPLRVYYQFRHHYLSVRLGFSIATGVFDKGLAIAHYGTIVVARTARVGQNCRIHEGVTIGATNGSLQAPKIGNNVFIASGAKIIGDITIADDVAIGANAVVVKSIEEQGTTWGGVPARKISDNSSRANLNKSLFE